MLYIFRVPGKWFWSVLLVKVASELGQVERCSVEDMQTSIPEIPSLTIYRNSSQNYQWNISGIQSWNSALSTIGAEFWLLPNKADKDCWYLMDDNLSRRKQNHIKPEKCEVKANWKNINLKSPKQMKSFTGKSHWIENVYSSPFCFSASPGTIRWGREEWV